MAMVQTCKLNMNECRGRCRLTAIGDHLVSPQMDLLSPDTWGHASFEQGLVILPLMNGFFHELAAT